MLGPRLRFQDFQVLQCDLVHDQRRSFPDGADRSDLGQVRFLERAEIVEERPRGSEPEAGVAQPEGIQALDLEFPLERLAPRAHVKPRGVPTRDACAPAGDLRSAQLGLDALGEDDLARWVFQEKRRQVLPRDLSHPELSGGDLRHRDADPIGRRMKRHDVVTVDRVEDSDSRDRPRGEDLHDLPIHETARLGRGLHLLRDRYRVPLAHEGAKVALDRMVWHARQGERAVLLLVAARKRDSEDTGGDEGVLAECLVEIPHPEKKDRSRMLGFEPPVLIEHRGGFHDRGVSGVRCCRRNRVRGGASLPARALRRASRRLPRGRGRWASPRAPLAPRRLRRRRA